MSKITNDRLNPVWHRMLYSCIHVATVGVKGLASVTSTSTRIVPRKLAAKRSLVDKDVSDDGSHGSIL